MKKDLLVLISLCTYVSCNASNYIFLPSFTATERYEDNLRLQSKNIQFPTNFITTLSPTFKFGYLREIGDLEANFKINQLLYDNESALDATETLLDAKYGFSAEHLTFTLQGNHSVQSSITTELTDVGSGILTNVNILRTNRSISPSLNYTFTENNSLQLNYNYNDASFDNSRAITNGLVGFSNQQFSAAILHRLSERQNISLSGAYSLFDAPQRNQSSESTSIQIGWQYTIDEQTRINLSIGRRSTDSTFLGGALKTTTNGQIFSINLNRATEWGNLNFNAGQQLNPASIGQQQQSTTLSLSATYNINERWNTRLTGSYLQTESTSNVNSANNRTFSSITPSLNWRYNEDAVIELSYIYRQQNFNNSQGSEAIGNTIRIQFSYQPKVNRQVK